MKYDSYFFTIVNLKLGTTLLEYIEGKSVKMEEFVVFFPILRLWIFGFKMLFIMLETLIGNVKVILRLKRTLKYSLIRSKLRYKYFFENQ